METKKLSKKFLEERKWNTDRKGEMTEKFMKY